MALTQAARVVRPRWWPAGLAWALWTLAMLGLATMTWLDHLLRQAGRADLAFWTADAAGDVLATVSAATAGAVLAGRRPRHPVGWLLLGLALSLVAAGVARGYAGYGLLARPGSLPAADWVAVYEQHGGIPTVACLGFILLLTPTGSLPSPRWPATLRRRPHHRRLQRPAAPTGRPGHPDRRAAGRGGEDDAAHPGVAVVAATTARRNGRRRPGPVTHVKDAPAPTKGRSARRTSSADHAVPPCVVTGAGL